MRKVFEIITYLLEPLLYPLSLIYGLIAWLRNKVYDKGIYNSIQFSVPVISVGNLSAGGTGKTPHIEYLIRLLQYEFQVATMSRGYRRRTHGFRLAAVGDTAETLGDEPMQFYSKYPETYVSVCADRMTGIPELMSLRPDTEIVLLDDAFQHRAVKAGLNILVMDYNHPFYKDHVLPFGRLREGRSGYKRADIIIVSKCPSPLSKQEQSLIIDQIAPLENQRVFFTEIIYGNFYDLFNRLSFSISPSAHLILVSGIARPEPMMRYLKAHSSFVHLLQYPDHHYFSETDLEEIKATYNSWNAPEKAVIVSEKDAVRLSLHATTLAQWKIPIYVLPIQIQFPDEQEEFDKLVLGYIQKEREENQWN